MERQIIYQGDITNLIPVRPPIADPNEVISGDWVCKLAVLDQAANVIVATREVTTKSEDNLYFIASLTPAETALLEVSRNPTEYSWAIQLSNDALTPNYTKEKHIPLLVRKQAIT